MTKQITPKLKEYLDKAPKFEDHFKEQFKNPEYVQAWLEMTLTDFLNDGDIDEFVDGLVTVVQNSERGIITQLAKNSGINRGNLSEIINGKVKPRLDTAVKILKGLGYNYSISVEKKPA